jgi:hypothetical protein
MKISSKQANLLAKEVVNQLKAKKVQKVSAAVKEQLNQFVDKRRELYNKKADAQEEINKHEQSLKKIVGNVRGIYGSETITQMIDKIEKKAIPSVSEIEDEIILKSMFNSEDDLTSFINAIVKKYEKKLQVKVASN